MKDGCAFAKDEYSVIKTFWAEGKLENAKNLFKNYVLLQIFFHEAMFIAILE